MDRTLILRLRDNAHRANQMDLIVRSTLPTVIYKPAELDCHKLNSFQLCFDHKAEQSISNIKKDGNITMLLSQNIVGSENEMFQHETYWLVLRPAVRLMFISIIIITRN